MSYPSFRYSNSHHVNIAQCIIQLFSIYIWISLLVTLATACEQQHVCQNGGQVHVDSTSGSDAQEECTCACVDGSSGPCCQFGDTELQLGPLIKAENTSPENIQALWSDFMKGWIASNVNRACLTEDGLGVCCPATSTTIEGNPTLIAEGNVVLADGFPVSVVEGGVESTVALFYVTVSTNVLCLHVDEATTLPSEFVFESLPSSDGFPPVLTDNGVQDIVISSFDPSTVEYADSDLCVEHQSSSPAPMPSTTSPYMSTGDADLTSAQMEEETTVASESSRERGKPKNKSTESLDGGAIAGLVIALLFLVVVTNIGLYVAFRLACAHKEKQRRAIYEQNSSAGSQSTDQESPSATETERTSSHLYTNESFETTAENDHSSHSIASTNQPSGTGDHPTGSAVTLPRSLSLPVNMLSANHVIEAPRSPALNSARAAVPVID